MMRYESDGENDSSDTNEIKRPRNDDNLSYSQKLEDVRKERVFMPEIFTASCKWIPLRLTSSERKLLDVLENALIVSDYTDTVDIWARSQKQSRVYEGLKDILSICLGLVSASDLKMGEKLMIDKNLDQNIPFFRDVFEIGRRYKIMNPGKMRDTYGKMMFILQDTVLVSEDLGDTFIKKIVTVHSYLNAKDSLCILCDERICDAVQSIDNSNGLLSQSELIALKRQKSNAISALKQKYASSNITEEEIQLVLDSIADNEAYLQLNAGPVDKMIKYLTTCFDPKDSNSEFSLALSVRSSFRQTFSNLYGYSSRYFGGGQQLSHDHSTQYHFVHQSMLLWHEIMRTLPKLWIMADRDLIQERYRLSDTGQGLHRMQCCPLVSDEMHRILQRVQSSVGQRWVG